MDQWCFIYATEHYSAIKRSKLLVHIKTWMKLKLAKDNYYYVYEVLEQEKLTYFD